MGYKRIGTIQWHEDQINLIRERHAKARGKVAKKYISHKIPNRGKVSVKYDFLKYLRVVMRWATENSGLSRPHVEVLLYLYCMGTFSKKQFHDFHKTLGIYEQKTLDNLSKEGWIALWRPASKKTKEHALYSLTHKGKLFCAKIHNVCCGEDEIPIEETRNKLAGNTGKRIDTYYMEMIKKMNKDKSKKK